MCVTGKIATVRNKINAKRFELVKSYSEIIRLMRNS